MIKDTLLWEQWERRWLEKEPIDFEQNLRIFEALYQEALDLHVWPPDNPLEGLETKIAIAKALNVPRAS